MKQPTDRAKRIFLDAVERQDDVQRSAFVAAECADNVELREEVDRLLRAYGKLGSFMESDATDSVAITQSPLEGAGAQIGPYKLLQEIGEGGMGVVYMAEQYEPVRRKVALKVIRPGMDTRQVIARFEAERQALSLMDHPNIARVLDAGATDTGRPYFVMELVKGQPITQYCDEKQLSPRQRLELLVPVCQAIQHAHQKGIIHRDIKPSNILVAEYDQQPVPKVIDFGVAKAISQPLTEKTMFTGFGQIVGTLEYMSPEQAKVNQLDIDTRSDVYSLGVLLYELLTGTTPFDKQRLRSVAWDEMLRIIREEEPPKPSTRLSHSKDSLPSISARRQTEPAKLTNLVRGELDWIVMKALEKNRARRYETANAFADDVQRYLDDDPVRACPPSAAYRFNKFLRRNKSSVLAISVVLLAVLIGASASIWQAIRATSAANGERQARIVAENAEAKERQQRQLAQDNAQEARRSFLRAREAVKEIIDALPDYAGGLLIVRRPNTDDVEYVQGSLSFFFTQLTADKQRDLVERALRYYDGFLEQDELDPDLRLEVATAYIYKAALAESQKASDNQDSEIAYRRTLEVLTQLAKPPSKPEVRYLLARCCARLARLLNAANGLDEADQFYAQAIAVQSTLISDFPTIEPYRQERAFTLYNRGTSLLHRGKKAEAESAYRSARIDFEACKNRQGAAFASRSLANLLVESGRTDEAERAFRDALANLEPPTVAGTAPPKPNEEIGKTHLRLAELHTRLTRPREAEQEFRLALIVYEELATSDPAKAAYSAMVCKLLLEIATLHREERESLMGVRDQFTRVVDRQQVSLSKKPNDAEIRRGLYLYRIAQADAAILASDHAAAAKTLIDAASVLNTDRTAIQRYNTACQLARCVALAQVDLDLTDVRREELVKQYGDDAITDLREALAKGFADSERLKKDKDLDSLRTRVEFQILAKEIEERAEKSATQPKPP